MPEVLHDVYLPFSEAVLLEHFAPVGADAVASDRKLEYYRSSLRDKGHQHEKDERFWIVTALLGLYHPEDARVERLAEALSRALGDPPPIAGEASWHDCLSGPLRLYFEVSLPSPPSYKSWLREHVTDRALIPHLQAAAQKPGSKLEGQTRVDAVLVAESGFAVLFEGKVLSDVSSKIAYDVMRNQIARSIDVMLDPNPRVHPSLAARDPQRTCFVLLTPEVFKDNPHSRLYGWLLPEYQGEPTALARDLPHRSRSELESVPQRLGWLTFEDCARIAPGTCRWISA